MVYEFSKTNVIAVHYFCTMHLSYCTALLWNINFMDS